MFCDKNDTSLDKLVPFTPRFCIGENSVALYNNLMFVVKGFLTSTSDSPGNHFKHLIHVIMINGNNVLSALTLLHASMHMHKFHYYCRIYIFVGYQPNQI